MSRGEPDPGEEPGPRQEVGNWSLLYLGPGFQVHLRAARRSHVVRLDGYMTPPLPLTVLLVALQGRSIVAETAVTDSGRFEFRTTALGATRLMFVGLDGEQPLLSPPFWL